MIMYLMRAGFYCSRLDLSESRAAVPAESRCSVHIDLVGSELMDLQS